MYASARKGSKDNSECMSRDPECACNTQTLAGVSTCNFPFEKRELTHSVCRPRELQLRPFPPSDVVVSVVNGRRGTFLHEWRV